ncbi:MAG: sigma-54-dependent transcriptional regulator [Planctomycetota bacterium]|jgi:DNA-binding NtrC family response regulator
MSDARHRVLIVDDDPIVAESIAESLAGHGYDTAAATSGPEALQALDDGAHGDAGHPARPFAVLICDMAMPGMDGLALIRQVRRRHPDVVPVAITGYGTIEAAVKTVRLGAIDYLTKPIVDDELRIAVEKAIRQQALLAENSSLRRQLDLRDGLDNIIGSDQRMRRIYGLVEAVAPSRTTVLMSGESGTGKSLIARAIHHNSPRADKPFVEISCGSIPETLLESELFGHVKGAFTGAHADKSGRFLAANEGTLFLDEINAASPAMQLKLLRVLQERTFEPVGSDTPVEVDVRVILASNQPLEDLVADGRFRQDLYYRINVVMIQLPPLRDRLGDIPALADHFLAQKSRDMGKQVIGFDEPALAALRAYAWPGNVRELENVVERAVVLTRGTRITLDDMPPHVIDNSTGRLLAGASSAGGGDGPSWSPPPEPLPLKEALEEPERRIILAALEANDWNRQKTADQLEINRTTLYKKIKHYGLDEQYGQAG